MRPITQHKKGKMNSIETEFAWIQERRKRAGEIIDYCFEGMTFRLADKTTYTPDFVIVHPDYFECIDCKQRGKIEERISKKTGNKYKYQWSSKTDDAAVKIKVAAEIYKWFKWAYYFREVDGKWTREGVN